MRAKIWLHEVSCTKSVARNLAPYLRIFLHFIRHTRIHGIGSKLRMEVSFSLCRGPGWGQSRDNPKSWVGRVKYGQFHSKTSKTFNFWEEFWMSHGRIFFQASKGQSLKIKCWWGWIKTSTRPKMASADCLFDWIGPPLNSLKGEIKPTFGPNFYPNVNHFVLKIPLWVSAPLSNKRLVYQ